MVSGVIPPIPRLDSMLCGPASPGYQPIRRAQGSVEVGLITTEHRNPDVRCVPVSVVRQMVIIRLASRTYTLKIVQHPDRGAEFCGASALSRLPLTPPLIAELGVRGPAGDERIEYVSSHMSSKVDTDC